MISIQLNQFVRINSVFLKSSVDPTTQLQGRPYGGLGFLCKKIEAYAFKLIESDCDRLLGIQLLKNQAVLLCVLGVYLPYNDNTKEQTQIFIETLDQLQCMMDNNCANIPTLIVGDMNTVLPENEFLCDNWYSRKPFNSNSGILYDFLNYNKMCVANFMCQQDNLYTFKRGKLQSYIDHVCINEYLCDMILDCKIISQHEDNLSDHLPLSTMLALSVSIPIDQSCPKKYESSKIFPKPNWQDLSFQEKYKVKVCSAINSVPLTDIDSISSDQALDYVNDLYNTLCDKMHTSVKQCIDIKHGKRPIRKRNSWWNQECTVTRNSNRLFHYIWKSCGRPSSGTVYDTYKSARKAYRQCCRRAVKNLSETKYKLLNNLRSSGTGKIWNAIRKLKNKRTSQDGISLDTLEDHFRQKFSNNTPNTVYISHSKRKVLEKHNELRDTKSFHLVTVPVYLIRRYINKLKSGSAAGFDGITAEHLKFATHSNLILRISNMFSICLTYGIVPDSFLKGIVVPILKKSTLDPSNPKHYRPITVSVTMSKLMEHYLLYQFQDHEPDKAQFGFVEHRGTNMATALAHDVGALCNSMGSPLYYCSLDAEGAFDNLPHDDLLAKLIDVIPDNSWLVLHYWYLHMGVQIRWGTHLSDNIPVTCGIRQGGLISPLAFNIFYEQLICKLQSNSHGVTIKGLHFNTFCYADDILICSTSVTGLQELINIATSYIVSHGLKFNPKKTSCYIMGRNPFTTDPQWFIDSELLKIEDSIPYLGSMLGDPKGKAHCESRIRATTRSYFALQGAGIKFPGAMLSLPWNCTMLLSGLVYTMDVHQSICPQSSFGILINFKTEF